MLLSVLQLKSVLAELHATFASDRYLLGNTRKALAIQLLCKSNISLKTFTVTAVASATSP